MDDEVRAVALLSFGLLFIFSFDFDFLVVYHVIAYVLPFG